LSEHAKPLAVRRIYVRILCTDRTLIIRKGVRANDSLFHSEVVSFL